MCGRNSCQTQESKWPPDIRSRPWKDVKRTEGQNTPDWKLQRPSVEQAVR